VPNPPSTLGSPIRSSRAPDARPLFPPNKFGPAEQLRPGVGPPVSDGSVISSSRTEFGPSRRRSRSLRLARSPFEVFLLDSRQSFPLRDNPPPPSERPGPFCAEARQGPTDSPFHPRRRNRTLQRRPRWFLPDQVSTKQEDELTFAIHFPR